MCPSSRGNISPNKGTFSSLVGSSILDMRVEPSFGLRQKEILEDKPGTAEESLRLYSEGSQRRRRRCLKESGQA